GTIVENSQRQDGEVQARPERGPREAIPARDATRRNAAGAGEVAADERGRAKGAGPILIEHRDGINFAALGAAGDSPAQRRKAVAVPCGDAVRLDLARAAEGTADEQDAGRRSSAVEIE